MEDFFKAISNLGFPIVVAGYLLFRFENKIIKLEDSIDGDGGLVSQIRKLRYSIKELIKKKR